MKKKELIVNFVRGSITGNSSSLSIEDNLLFSYGTPIGFRNQEDKLFATDKKFSSTTSTDQNYLKTFDVKVLPNEEYKELLKNNGVLQRGLL